MADIEDLLDDHPGLKKNWDMAERSADPVTWASFHEAVCSLALQGGWQQLPPGLQFRFQIINDAVSDIAWISALRSEEEL